MQFHKVAVLFPPSLQSEIIVEQNLVVLVSQLRITSTTIPIWPPNLSFLEIHAKSGKSALGRISEMLSEEGGTHIRKRGRVWPKGNNEDGDMGEKGSFVYCHEWGGKEK